MSPSVSIVVLNWNGLRDTLRCLDSLAAAQVSFGKIHIVVIDNGSLVDPREDVIKRVPEVDFLRLEHNVGYAAGCNLGAGRALSRGANFILFLNNDTVITPSLFEDLLTCFSRNPEVGIASPLIYDMSETPRIDFAGGHVNFALGRFSHRRQPPKEREPFETGYVSGCCMMISKTVIDRVGLFDEKLFAYFEDVDLSLRAQQAGFKTVCVPSTSIKHAGSASTRRNLNQGTISPLKHYLIARNRAVIVERYASQLAKWFHTLITNQVRIVFYVTAFVLRGRWSKLRWFLRGISDGVRCNLNLPAQLDSTP